MEAKTQTNATRIIVLFAFLHNDRM